MDVGKGVHGMVVPGKREVGMMDVTKKGIHTDRKTALTSGRNNR